MDEQKLFWDIYEVIILSETENGELIIGEADNSAGWIARVSPDELWIEGSDNL